VGGVLVLVVESALTPAVVRHSPLTER